MNDGVGRGRLLTAKEVAAMFRVDKKTPGRWALAGKIGCMYTPGGRRRFWEAEVRELLVAEGAAVDDSEDEGE